MEYEAYFTTTLECGCKVDIDHLTAIGCCCGQCYIYQDCDYDVGRMIQACATHGG